MKIIQSSLAAVALLAFALPAWAASETSRRSDEIAPIAAIPEEAMEVYIKRYVYSRDHYVKGARKAVEEAKSAKNKAFASYSYKSSKERKDAETAAMASLMNAEQHLKLLLEDQVPCWIRSAEIFGIQGAMCVQKVGKKSAIVKYDFFVYVPANEQGAKRLAAGMQYCTYLEEAYVEGVDASNFIDGRRIGENEQIFFVSGTKTYTTVLGAPRTIRMATPIDMNALHAAAVPKMREQ